MAYFSNGAEGEDAEELYCRRCVHEHCCPVWLLHQRWNYEACRDSDVDRVKHEALDTLWPHEEGNMARSFNGECRMFYQKGSE